MTKATSYYVRQFHPHGAVVLGDRPWRGYWILGIYRMERHGVTAWWRCVMCGAVVPFLHDEISHKGRIDEPIHHERNDRHAPPCAAGKHPIQLQGFIMSELQSGDA